MVSRVLPKRPVYYENLNRVKNRLDSLYHEFSDIPIEINDYNNLNMVCDKHVNMGNVLKVKVIRVAILGDAGRGHWLCYIIGKPC